MVIPKQHGAWAMLIIPFLLGMHAGAFTWLHIPLFIGWFFLYLATYLFLSVVKKQANAEQKKWLIIYSITAMIALIFPVLSNWRIIYFGLAMIPFFLVNLYFAKMKKERAFLNDVCAIINFSIGALGSYYLGVQKVDEMAFIVFTLSVLFFIGSTFYVKTMIREKNNPLYKWASWGFHSGLILLLLISGNGLMALAYVPSLIRAIYFYGKLLSIKKIGIYEIANSVYFALMTMIILS
jgi:hypothetical protein